MIRVVVEVTRAQTEKQAVAFVRIALEQTYSEEDSTHWLSRVKSMRRVLSGITSNSGDRTRSISEFSRSVEGLAKRLLKLSAEMKGEPLTIQQTTKLSGRPKNTC